MLMHHSEQPYDVAASEAAREARSKMEALFSPGQGSAQRVLEHVQTQVPVDMVVPGHRLEIEEDHEAKFGIVLGVRPQGRDPQTFGLVKHSFTQLCQQAGFPLSYANDLLDPVQTGSGESKRRSWAVELVQRNLQALYHHSTQRKFLVRTIGRDARGFMSNAYRRLDCRPLLESFGKACQDFGLVPVDGKATETRVELKAMLPLVFEPIEHEVMCFGVSWANSDYGNGAHSMRSFVLRLKCTNKAIGDECLRQVHLGKRIDDDSVFSERTKQLDTQTAASALYDIVGSTLSAEKINAYQNRVRAAHAEEIDRKALPARLARLDLGKQEQQEILSAYDSNDVEMLPPGGNTWRLSNAISWFAGTRAADDDRRLELERLAGKVLPGAAKEPS